MSSFYITLPSNSSADHFPNNSPGHFFTDLPQNIELSDQYEVGLSEIQFINHFINLKECKVSVYNKESELEREVIIPPDSYANTSSLNKVLNKKLLPKDNTSRDGVTFKYSHRSKLVSILLPNEVGKVVISDNLKHALGFSTNTFEKKRKHVAENETCLQDDFRNIFVYSDIVRPRIVGDVMVPLLRTVPTDITSANDVHVIYEKPHYIPLSRFQFNTIEILLASKTGAEITFKKGPTVVTLHIRRKKPDY